LSSHGGWIRFEDVAKAAMPMILAEMVVLVAVIAFPSISVALPRFFGFMR
jgi:TRAP-type C4-dicarboxylate transport system permease large subunit